MAFLKEMTMKISKKTRSNIFNGLIIIVTLGMVLLISAQGGDISDAWDALRAADPVWVGLAIASWCVFMTFEAMGLHVFFLEQKVKIKFRLSLLVAMIGSFYSCVTPAATGGQPMQVLALSKRKYPAGISSSGLAVKFFTFQLALLSLGGILWIIHPDIVNACAGDAKWVVAAGFFINGLTVAAVLVFAINKNWVRAGISFIILIGYKLRLIRNKEKITARAENALRDFHASVDMLTYHPIQLFHLYLISCLQVMGLMSIAYCVYRAMGLSQHSFGEILTLQFLLYIGASFTPLPGASGAQEGGFYLFFQNVFPADKLVGALLLWRFFSYYFTMILGLLAVMWDSVWSIRHNAGEQPKGGADLAPETHQSDGPDAAGEKNNQ